MIPTRNLPASTATVRPIVSITNPDAPVSYGIFSPFLGASIRYRSEEAAVRDANDRGLSVRTIDVPMLTS